MKFRNVKVRKPGGGYRTQRAMVLASGRLKFVSNKRKGRASPQRASAMAKSKSIARRRSSSGRRRYHLARLPRRSRRRGGGGGNMPLLHIGGAALGLAYIANNVPSVQSTLAKIPGAKTFGAPAAAGLACLAVDRFVKPNRWLKLAGVAGIVLAASQVGTKGSSFKWVGDGDVADFEVEGDDDIADYDEGDDE